MIGGSSGYRRFLLGYFRFSKVAHISKKCGQREDDQSDNAPAKNYGEDC